MPELPEAETIAVELHRHLVDQVVGRVTVLRKDVIHGDPRPLTKVLRRRRIKRVYRRAKRVVLELEPGADLVFRLGMSGQLTLEKVDAPTKRHTHVRIVFPSLNKELRFCDPRRFGGVWCLAGHKRHVGTRMGDVGVEPLDTNLGVFAELLCRRRQIKALLMDQSVIAGLGNIYCDEALYAARIHPLTPARNIDRAQANKLLRYIKSILRKAIEHQGSTLSDYRRVGGEDGGFQQFHRVYGRERDPCHSCGTKILRIQAMGRSTHLCPRCQVLDP
jgi:formamidopyrimidine-DNA glycosylase